MPTTIIHTVGTSGTRDYTSLSAWEAANRRDLVAADEIEVVECYNDGEMTDACTIMGWTTDATHYIKIYAPPGQCHTGDIDTGFHLKYNNGYVFNVYVGNVIIDSLELEYTGIGGVAGSDGHVYSYPHEAGTITVSNCLFQSGELTLGKSLQSIYHLGVPNEGMATWFNTGTLTGVYYVYSLLAASDGNLYAGTYYQAGTLGKVFKSDDDGATWTETGALTGATRVFCLLEVAGTLYAGTAPNGDVFKSTDGGTTWNTIADIPWNIVYSLFASDGVIYATGVVNVDPFDPRTVTVVPPTPLTTLTLNNRQLLVNAPGGVGTGQRLQVTNVTRTTTETVRISSCAEPRVGGDDPGDVYLETALTKTYLAGDTVTAKFLDVRGLVFTSVDGGVSWVETGPLQSTTSKATSVNCLLRASSGALYAGTQPDGDVYKSIDGGITWTNTGNLASATIVEALCEASDGTLYAGTGTNGDVFKSADGGTTWTNTANLPNQRYVSSIIEATNGFIYVTTQPTGSYNGFVLFTNNGGVSWTNAGTIQNASGTPIPLFYQLIQHPTNDLLYVGCALQLGQGYVFKGVISTGGDSNLVVTDNKYNWVNQDNYEAIATEGNGGIGTILIQNNTMVCTGGTFVSISNGGALTQTGNTVTFTGDVCYAGEYDFEGAITISDETLTFVGDFNTGFEISADSAAQAIIIHNCTINMDGDGCYGIYIEVSYYASTIDIYENNILVHESPTKQYCYGVYIYDELGISIDVYRNKIFSTGDGSFQGDGIYIDTDGGIVKLYNNMIANFYSGAFVDTAALEIYSYYNSVHYCYQGIFSNSTDILYKNTVITSMLRGVNYYDFDTAHTHLSSDYNASIASVAYAAPGAHALHGVVPADIYLSVLADNENLHIKNVAAVIYDAGIDVSSDPNLPVANDYDGDARVRPDIGADEFQGAVTHTATFTLDAIIQSTVDASIVMAAFTPTKYLRGRLRRRE